MKRVMLACRTRAADGTQIGSFMTQRSGTAENGRFISESPAPQVEHPAGNRHPDNPCAEQQMVAVIYQTWSEVDFSQKLVQFSVNRARAPIGLHRFVSTEYAEVEQKTAHRLAYQERRDTNADVPMQLVEINAHHSAP